MILQKITDAVDWLGDLSADIFWGTVTSYPAIAIFGAVAAATFAIAHLPALIEKVFPSVAVYTRVAAQICLISSAALMFAFGYRVADGRAEIEELKNDLAYAQFDADQQRQTALAADDLKREADQRAATAEGRLSEYETKFGKNPLDPPAGYLEWLRSLQQHPARRAGADQPQPDLVDRVRALGGKHQ